MKLEQDYRIVFLKRFNKRDVNAFAEIYTAFFTELHVYALRFYLNRPEMAEDAVQEAFCYLWEREDITFDCLDKIKAFLYVAINLYQKLIICRTKISGNIGASFCG